MPLIIERDAVLETYAQAADKGWVIPTICTENLTCTEAILTAAKDHAEWLNQPDIPITIAMTNLYSHRSQSLNYTRTRRWDIGLRLFLADLEVLTAPGSPFQSLRVMIHLDHIQHDADRELLDWDVTPFSSIMFDASTLPFDQNIAATRHFVEKRGKAIVVEGACDEIVDAEGREVSKLTSPENAERYINQTGVDLIVANLGTEHRASAADLKYQGALARRIKERIGPKLVLHGCSSVSADQLATLYDDGVCKVNIWTMLERDSAPVLLKEMVTHAAQVAGAEAAAALQKEGLLGTEAEVSGRQNLDYFTTVYRQQIVFNSMKDVVRHWLNLWYTRQH